MRDQHYLTNHLWRMLRESVGRARDRGARGRRLRRQQRWPTGQLRGDNRGSNFQQRATGQTHGTTSVRRIDVTIAAAATEFPSLRDEEVVSSQVPRCQRVATAGETPLGLAARRRENLSATSWATWASSSRGLV